MNSPISEEEIRQIVKYSVIEQFSYIEDKLVEISDFLRQEIYGAIERIEQKL